MVRSEPGEDFMLYKKELVDWKTSSIISCKASLQIGLDYKPGRAGGVFFDPSYSQLSVIAPGSSDHQERYLRWEDINTNILESSNTTASKTP